MKYVLQNLLYLNILAKINKEFWSPKSYPVVKSWIIFNSMIEMS